VTVTQAWGVITLSLSGQRLIEKAWILQRDYARLTVTTGNAAAVPVDRFVILRNSGGEGYRPLHEISGSTVQGAEWIYNDAFLLPGTAYSYKVVAYDALGGVITESNEITI